jgi:O-acetyl-ADP-ribose deacetylase (regulator of RNase III)
VSDAGLLPARIVIHAVGPIWRGGHAGEPDLLASAYRTSLDLAAAEGARSVTLPAISCGVYGYPIEAAAAVAIGTVRAWLREHPAAIDSVTFVLFSNDALEAFERARDAG